jgi:hypothetical protein
VRESPRGEKKFKCEREHSRQREFKGIEKG